jgi:hypothetical protein
MTSEIDDQSVEARQAADRRARGEEFLQLARKLREDIGRRRNGVPLPDSAEDIRLAREERDLEMDAWLFPDETAPPPRREGET